MIKKWWNDITTSQKIWVVGATLAVAILGILSGDTPINILIGTVGMFYVAVYSTGVRGAFLLGIVYVGLYTIICLQNRIMLDALQNIILIPIYIASYLHWGKADVKPRNMTNKQRIITAIVLTWICAALYGLSVLLHGNYSGLDALNTTMTLGAMAMGYYGFSENWIAWSINNVVSAITFGLVLFTPTGSITVFAMKMLFFINGLIGWYNFYKQGELKEC